MKRKARVLILLSSKACNKTRHIIKSKEGSNLSDKIVYFSGFCNRKFGLYDL